MIMAMTSGPCRGQRQVGARTDYRPHHASCQTELMHHLYMALLVSLLEQCHNSATNLPLLIPQ